jgi:type III secretory pathway component EscT
VIDAATRALATERALDLGLHALRVVPVTALSPFLGGPLLPAPARLALALALGAVAASGAPAPGPAGGADVMWAAARELALGGVLAVAAALPFELARAAGRIVDTLRGATLAELHVAPIRQRETAVGDLLVQWMLALAAWSGADRLVVAAVLATFHDVPVGAPLPAPGLEGAATAVASLLGAAFVLGSPAAAAVLASELALATAARIAPRAGFPDATPAARAAAGLAAVGLAVAALSGRLVEISASPVAVLRLVAGGPP